MVTGAKVAKLVMYDWTARKSVWLVPCAMHHGRAQLKVGLASPVGIDGEVVKGKMVQYDLTVAGFEGPGGQVGLGRLRRVLGSIGSFRSDGPPMPCRHQRPGDVEQVSH
jgi:hypothetical protein